MASVAWCHEQLDEMCARVQREAASTAERIIAAMDDFADVSRAEQRGHFRRYGARGPVRRPHSRWELDRIVFPKVLADLDDLDAAGPGEVHMPA